MNIKYIDTGTLYEGLKGAVVNNSTRISQKNGIPYICLLYTSDAADEL